MYSDKKGATLGFYFAGLGKEEANDIRAKLNTLAAKLGYYSLGGPTAGEGNAAALLVALAKGEIHVAESKFQGHVKRILAEVGDNRSREVIYEAIWREWTLHVLPVLAPGYHDITNQSMYWLDALMVRLGEAGLKINIREHGAIHRMMKRHHIQELRAKYEGVLPYDPKE